MNLLREIIFTVQDKMYKVCTDNLDIDTTLNSYLRNQLHLTGTKRMCLEGGCGACIVAVKKRNNVTGKHQLHAVNSCLISLFSCHGWEIYTIEGLKSSSGELHPIQESLVNHNGSQCGYCTPGMIMNMYALYENGPITESDVENSFGGNICRCTGYRSIIEGFKSLCKDRITLVDIEDVSKCNGHCKPCNSSNGYKTTTGNQPFYYKSGDKLWIKVFSMADLKCTLKTFGNSDYVLVSGNTAQGVYRMKRSEITIDISDVTALKTYTLGHNNLRLGANMTLADTILVFKKLSKVAGFNYLEEMANHIDLIANVPVRNMGTLAGNLMIKHTYPEFPSDLLMIFECANAKLLIVNEHGEEFLQTPSNFLKLPMKGKILESMQLTKLSDRRYTFRCYKVMSRAQNTHALLNGAFLFGVDASYTVSSASIVFGNISPDLVHATKAENYVIERSLLENDILQYIYRNLEEELLSHCNLPSNRYKISQAISLLYKFILSIVPKNFISKRHFSGGSKLERPLSKGTQKYETKESLYPLTYPHRKIEVGAQVTGEAEYVNDIPDMPGQLFASFVLTDAPPNSRIKHVDVVEALKTPRVVAYFDKDDIPGKNNFMPEEANFSVEEEIFCSGTIKYYHQPLGIIVAETEETARKAADLVKISYNLSDKPVLVSIGDIVKRNVKEKIVQYCHTKPTSFKTVNDKHLTVKGTLDLSWQYHFHMENQCCTVVPKEDSLDVYPSSQWLDLSQVAIATSLGLPANMINISIRRLGGGFGAKISRNSLVACAACLAAHHLKKPVKMWIPLEMNMSVIGKRCPLTSDYEVTVDANGVIQHLKNIFYSDYGVGGNEASLPYIMDAFTSTYDTATWEIEAYSTHTDTPANCWIRAPGTTEGSCMIESIMEHIAYAVDKDPLHVRCLNLNTNKHCKLQAYITTFKTSANIENRKQQIQEFNMENRWKKRGISVVPMTYNFHIFTNYGVIVSIYQADGSIAIAHGGVEMGQGINTKVVQVCAQKFGVNTDKIRVKPSNNLIAPNSGMTGGSLTSEGVCYGVIKACDILLKRMDPVKRQNPHDSWEDIVKKCFNEFINLSASSMSSPKEPDLGDYTVYGVCASEVEVDILTGQYYVRRVDILEDAGVSMNPAVDIGQIEGGFVMGMGYHTSENIILGVNGKLQTNRTWNYTPPTFKDIPVDFRIELLKNSSNPVGVLNSKATGEPPMCLSCSVPLSIRNAVASARIENGYSPWYPIDGPSTVENTFMNCLNNYENYTL